MIEEFYSDSQLEWAVHVCLDPEISAQRERAGYGPAGIPQIVSLIKMIQKDSYQRGLLSSREAIRKALGL
jgi:hypothetical protein